MKNLIFFATLLIFISDNVISAEAKDELFDPVLDMDGDNLTTGTSYYIVPNLRPGGGVSIYPTANKTTYAVAQLPLSGVGLPVTFLNGETDQGEVVREYTNIIIAFSPGILFFPAVWKLDEYDEAIKQQFVTAGEFYGNLTSISILFRIREDPTLGGYRFFFCPIPVFCKFCPPICNDVGIYIDGAEGVRRLGLVGNLPFTFTFRKFQPACANSNVLEA